MITATPNWISIGAALADHLWQSTLCIGLAWLLTITLRRAEYSSCDLDVCKPRMRYRATSKELAAPPIPGGETFVGRHTFLGIIRTGSEAGASRLSPLTRLKTLHRSMTTSRIGCEQQTRRLPSAGLSSGSGP